jgi:hypothetical protein
MRFVCGCRIHEKLVLSLPSLRIPSVLQDSRPSEEARHQIPVIRYIKGWMSAHPAPKEVTPCTHVVEYKDMGSLQSMAIRNGRHYRCDNGRRAATLSVSLNREVKTRKQFLDRFKILELDLYIDAYMKGSPWPYLGNRCASRPMLLSVEFFTWIPAAVDLWRLKTRAFHRIGYQM